MCLLKYLQVNCMVDVPLNLVYFPFCVYVYSWTNHPVFSDGAPSLPPIAASSSSNSKGDDLMRAVIRTEKDLAKGGQDRAIPTSVATAVAKEIKNFLEDQAPLMSLMSSPGIKKVRLL